MHVYTSMYVRMYVLVLLLLRERVDSICCLALSGGSEFDLDVGYLADQTVGVDPTVAHVPYTHQYNLIYNSDPGLLA